MDIDVKKIIFDNFGINDDNISYQLEPDNLKKILDKLKDFLEYYNKYFEKCLDFKNVLDYDDYMNFCSEYNYKEKNLIYLVDMDDTNYNKFKDHYKENKSMLEIIDFKYQHYNNLKNLS